MPCSDKEVKRDVVNQLARDGSVHAAEINVSGGVVELEGKVPNSTARRGRLTYRF